MVHQKQRPLGLFLQIAEKAAIENIVVIQNKSLVDIITKKLVVEKLLLKPIKQKKIEKKNALL